MFSVEEDITKDQFIEDIEETIRLLKWHRVNEKWLDQWQEILEFKRNQ